MCLSTNPAGFLPVNLALIKLGIKFSLQALTRGDFFGMFQASTDPVEFKPKLPPLPQTEEKVEDDGLLTWTKGETFENLLILALCLVAAWLAFQRFQ